MKRLAICATNSSANISAGLLMLISEVIKARPALASMLIQMEDVGIVNDDSSRERFGPYDASKREPSMLPLPSHRSGRPRSCGITRTRP